MPPSIIIADVGSKEKVIGRRRAMDAVGPRPGSTPTIVPITHPIKHKKRFKGCRATERPKPNRCKASMDHSLIKKI